MAEFTIVAWLHSERPDSDVITTKVKDVLDAEYMMFGVQPQIQRTPVRKTEYYTVPLVLLSDAMAENAKLRGEVERLTEERDDWIACHARVWKRLQRAHKAIEAMRVAGGSEEFQVAFDAAKGLALCSELIGEPTRDVSANPEETSDCHGPDWTERDGEYLK